MTKTPFIAALLAFGISPTLPTSTLAASETFKGEFSITLYGLPLARTHFTTVVNGTKFAIDGSVLSAGVGAIFDDTRGTVAVRGIVANNGTKPSSYALKYTSGGKKKATNIGFSGGSVASANNVPPTRKKGEWIEVLPAQLKAVSDPLTGMVVRAQSLGDVCNRTIRVFDGETRADFVMSLARQGAYKTRGYSGPVAECAVKFVPVSGFEKGKKQLEFLRKNKNIRISFAPIGTTGLFAPIAARVGTQIGTVAVDASRFEAIN